MATIFIIEDSESQRAALEEYLTSVGRHTVHTASNGSGFRDLIERETPDLILSDLMLPDATGIEMVKEFRERFPGIPFLILTGQPSIESAVEAIHAGANDYIMKPVDLAFLRKKIDSLLETELLKSENRKLRARISEVFAPQNLIGSSPAFAETVNRALQIARTDVTVLLDGESGTGKEMIANLIHENSKRSGRPFIKVNCGALTKSILESELFGVVRGAYTGAERDRPGYFEAADGGSIFLDEIGEMDLESQVRLLRVIEEREVVRIGSTKPIKVDVRIVAATNRNLSEDVDEDRFREDLYYRLAVIRLQLPPLRNRREDIPLLFNHFVVKFNEAHGKSVTRLSPELLRYFQTYDWPGNIRQFRNVIEGMVVLATEDTLEIRDLPPGLDATPKKSASRLKDSVRTGVPLDEYEKAIILKNLEHFGGNREKAAEALRISERTLYRKIKEWGTEI
jgi:DNA-binding NtrC family response regulator